MRFRVAISLFAFVVLAQSVMGQEAKSAVQAAPPANPQVASAKGFYDYMKGNVLKTADKVPEPMYAFKASPEVRSLGQILAHIADAQTAFCSIVKDGKPSGKGYEKTATTKAAIQAALKESFELCDAAYAGLTDAGSAEVVPFLQGRKATKLSIISFTTAHGLEHYGNLVVYMRLNQMVPPSSEAQ